MSEIKYFQSVAGAEKYAENASRKYEDDRYVIASSVEGYYVQTDSQSIDTREMIIAHYKNGEKQ